MSWSSSRRRRFKVGRVFSSLFFPPLPKSHSSKVAHTTIRGLDIYSLHQKYLESFRKTDFNDRGKDLGGIVWEEDPVRHRTVAKKVSHAFSSRALKDLEPVMHNYIDYFVDQMKECGAEKEGVSLLEWTHWLAMDIASDVAWNERMNQMRDSMYSLLLISLRAILFY